MILNDGFSKNSNLIFTQLTENNHQLDDLTAQYLRKHDRVVMIANVSHVLRTPTSRIQAVLDIAVADGAFLNQKMCYLMVEDLNEPM